MSQVFAFGRYLLYFWTGEDAEPIHIHVTVKRPEKNATKFWLLSDVGVGSHITRAIFHPRI